MLTAYPETRVLATGVFALLLVALRIVAGQTAVEAVRTDVTAHVPRAPSDRNAFSDKTTFSTSPLVRVPARAWPRSEPVELSGRGVQLVDGTPRLFVQGETVPAVGWFDWWFLERRFSADCERSGTRRSASAVFGGYWMRMVYWV